MILEIRRHSGPARLGRLHFEGRKIPTPTLFFLQGRGAKADDDLVLTLPGRSSGRGPLVWDYGSLFLPREVREFGILPDWPAGGTAPREIAEHAVEETIRFAEGYPDHGAVLHGSRFLDLRLRCAEAFQKRPLVAVGGGSFLLSRPRLLVQILPAVREALSPNTTLYFPSAPPHLFPLLAYLGVDLFDTLDGLLGAGKGRYATLRGSLPVAGMQELPCPCEVCRRSTPEALRASFEDLFSHNLQIALQSLAEVREAIRTHRLRELVEARASSDLASMTALRLLDREGQAFLERYTPITP
jgi:queuine/archaeosine tRNA-ribosyltransferase